MTLYVFPFCRVAVHRGDRYVETQFPSGKIVPATPNDTDEARQRAYSLGYKFGNGIRQDLSEFALWNMTVDHELTHTWLALCDGSPWSLTLYTVAHEIPGLEVSINAEEARVLEFQKNLDKDSGSRPWDTSPFVRRERFVDWPSAT